MTKLREFSHAAALITALAFAFLLAGCISPQLQELRNSPGSIQVLLVTQGNRVFEYDVAGFPTAARGYPQPFAQWHAVILDENRQALAMYSIWDPRLTLEHTTVGPIWLPIDSTTSYLFDVVVPFTFDAQDPDSLRVLPRVVQIYDEAKTLLFEVDLTATLDTYCTEGGAGFETNACRERRDQFPLPVLPFLPQGLRLPNYQTPVEDRPQATTDPAIIFANPAPIADCVPLYGEQVPDIDVTRDKLTWRASACQLLTEETSALACPSMDFVPGQGLFAAGANLGGLTWDYETFTLTLQGAGRFTGDGLLLEAGSSLTFGPQECILSSVETILEPAAVAQRRLNQSGKREQRLVWDGCQQPAGCSPGASNTSCHKRRHSPQRHDPGLAVAAAHRHHQPVRRRAAARQGHQFDHPRRRSGDNADQDQHGAAWAGDRDADADANLHPNPASDSNLHPNPASDSNLHPNPAPDSNLHPNPAPDSNFHTYSAAGTAVCGGFGAAESALGTRRSVRPTAAFPDQGRPAETAGTQRQRQLD